MKVLIAVATYNRPLITGICLENLSGFRSPDVRLVAYDDASTAYDKAYLSGFCDEVVRFPSNGGIARSRARALRDFIYRYTDFDLLYLTDSDTVHDAQFLSVARSVFATQTVDETPMALSLFNSRFHSAPENILGETPELYFTRTIPGASVCYDRRIAATVAEALDRIPELESAPGWDWNYMRVLGRPSILSRVSYVEHFARDRDEGGMHNKSSGLGDAGLADFETDRAVNPTPWLAEIRPRIIERLLY
jgi:hypothetical protein